MMVLGPRQDELRVPGAEGRGDRLCQPAAILYRNIHDELYACHAQCHTHELGNLKKLIFCEKEMSTKRAKCKTNCVGIGNVQSF